MLVVNREKERAKISLRFDLQNSITILTEQKQQIESLIAAVNAAIEGVPSGRDTAVIDCCQRALKNVANAINALSAGRTYVERLDIYEEVDDG